MPSVGLVELSENTFMTRNFEKLNISWSLETLMQIFIRMKSKRKDWHKPAPGIEISYVQTGEDVTPS